MKNLGLKTLVGILATASLVTVFFGGLTVGQGSSDAAPVPDVDLSSFWQVWRLIESEYVPVSSSTPETVSDQVKIYGAISGLVESLGDPYTVFLPPEENQFLTEEIEGNFGGVGIEIGVRDGQLVVIAPLKDTPADRAGIMPGDQIIEIDGQAVAPMLLDEAIRLIRGEVGTTVSLTIDRDGEIKEFELTRAVINIPVLDTEVLADGVFLIRLYNFGPTSPTLFRGALRQFIETGSSKLIIDLRGNPGGFLDAAIEITSWFLPVGSPITRERQADEAASQVYRSRGYHVITAKTPVAILIDGGSASASEIMAGALSHYDRAVLVGEPTFGKGSVQELIPVTEDTSLKLTIAEWLLPGGQSLDGVGLMPDWPVESEEDESGDRALERAIELVTGNHG